MSQTSLTEPPPTSTAPKRRWWRRRWIAPLWVISLAFVALRLPDYLGFTPERSLSPIRGYGHYLILSAHIMLGSVALIACCMQLWPRLRNSRPKLHRVTGRVYVAVVIPASVLAGVSSVLAVATPPSGRAGNVMLSVLWLATTLLGFHHARNRRFADHRRWMIRSFALCFSIILNRVWIGIYIAVLIPFYDGYYGGDMDAFIADVAVGSIWTSWITSLLFAEWWMSRRRKPARRVAATG